MRAELRTGALTRRHFEAIAAVLREERPDRDGSRWADGARDSWSTIVLAFARLCHDGSNLTPNGNRAFDRDRFYRAAGFIEEERERCATVVRGRVVASGGSPALDVDGRLYRIAVPPAEGGWRWPIDSLAPAMLLEPAGTDGWRVAEIVGDEVAS